MKTILLIIILFVLQYSIYCQTSSSNKHGLIIAIGSYPEKSGWMSISSANDIPLVKNALLSQGFKEENIWILKDSSATKNGIENAFLKLQQSSKAGDYVVIHYSGHGQQITDDNGDEIDGYDESLVPFNAPAFYEKKTDYRGSMHLRDDEFGLLIENLRLKLGKDGQVVVFVDACHSGSGTRGDAKIRGGKAPLDIPGGNSKVSGKDKGSGMPEQTYGDNAGPSSKAPFIVMSATQFDELDYETYDDQGKGVGPLSWAIAKVFSDIRPDDTYLSVFTRISAEMSKVVFSQTPTIEGDYNYKLFNGEIVEQQEYYTISRITSGKSIEINGGQIQGLNVGDKVGLYPGGTAGTENQKPLVTGKISSAENFNSLITFDKDFDVKYKSNYWVFVEERNFKNNQLKVKLEDFTDDVLKTNLEKDLNDYKLVVYDEKNAEIAIIDSNDKLVIKQIAQGIVLNEFSKPVKVKEIIDIIKQYAQAGFVRNLNLNDDNYRVEVEMIPVVPVLNSNGDIATDAGGNFIIKDTLKVENLMVDGKIHVGKDDCIMLKITNKGKRDAYFNIIELQPDGIILDVMPKDDTPANELFVKAGKSIIPRNFIIAGFAPPFGTEMYKVFATPQPINLTSIITKREASTKGNLSDIEKVIMGTYANTKGDETTTIKKKESGSTFDFTFIIVDK